jgi:hypothetical protein
LLKLPVIKNQTAFNLDRWDELCADEQLAKIGRRMETDRCGGIVMDYPAEYSHGGKQMDIGGVLLRLLPEGRTTAECPISTSEGVNGRVRVVGVQSTPREDWRPCGAEGGSRDLRGSDFSPEHARGDRRKAPPCFEAGAKEVWTCERDGRMRFFLRAKPALDAGAAKLCPEMPVKIDS